MKLNLTKSFALLLICCLYSIGSMAQEQPQWMAMNLGLLTPQQTAMAVNQANGTPYVLYTGNGLPKDGVNKAQVKMRNGTEWETVGNTGFSMGSISWSSIVVTPQGVPYVAFRDAGNENKATVMKLNTTTNTWETIFTSTGAATHTTLALHSTGVPVLAFVDASTTPANRAVVMRYTGTGTAWEAVGSAEGISAGAVTFTSIAFDSNNNLHLVYTEGGTPVVQKFNGTAWEAVGGTSLAGVTGISNTDIAIGPNNVPYILFRTGEAKTARAARVMKLEGNAWVNVGAATGFGVVNPSFGGTESIDFMNIEIGSDNVPFVGMMESTATTNHNRATVYRFNAATSAWEALGGGPAGPTINSSNEGFALYKANNTAYISARDASTTDRPLYVWQFNAGSTTTSAAKDIANSAKVQVYPNPSASSFRFTAAGKFSYTVYNSAGQVMELGKGVGDGEVGASFRAGLYFIKLQTEAGNQTLKLLKQ